MQGMRRLIATGCFLAALWSAAAWAGSLEPAVSTIREDQVTAVIMHYPLEGAGPAALDFVVVFEAGLLRYQDASLGTAAQAAGKQLYASLNEPGRLRVVIRGYDDREVGAGMVAHVAFARTSGAAAATALQVTGVAMAGAEGGRLPASGGSVSLDLPERRPEEERQPVGAQGEQESLDAEETPPVSEGRADSSGSVAGADRARLEAALSLARRLRAEIGAQASQETERERTSAEQGTAQETDAPAPESPRALAPAIEMTAVNTADEPETGPSPLRATGSSQDPSEPAPPFDARAGLMLIAGLGLLAVLALARRWCFTMS